MGKRILLVGEDVGFRRVFTHAIREALVDEGLGLAFVEAGSLAEAHSRLREGDLDAVLIDVTMPDANGLGLVGEIHDGGVGSPIPTLVLTASLDASVAVGAMDAGARGALQAGSDACDHGRDKDADRPQNLGGMSPTRG